MKPVHGHWGGSCKGNSESLSLGGVEEVRGGHRVSRGEEGGLGLGLSGANVEPACQCKGT